MRYSRKQFFPLLEFLESLLRASHSDLIFNASSPYSAPLLERTRRERLYLSFAETTTPTDFENLVMLPIFIRNRRGFRQLLGRLASWPVVGNRFLERTCLAFVILPPITITRLVRTALPPRRGYGVMSGASIVGMSSLRGWYARLLLPSSFFVLVLGTLLCVYYSSSSLGEDSATVAGTPFSPLPYLVTELASRYVGPVVFFLENLIVSLR